MPLSMRTEGIGGDVRRFNIELTDVGDSECADAKVPVKIGDGNFGIVLAAQSAEDAHDYALKIIYDHVIPARKQDRSPTYDSDLVRVEAELRIGVDLPEKLRQFVKDHKSDARLDADFRSVAQRPPAHIVLPLAYSVRFRQFRRQGCTRAVGRQAVDARLSHGPLPLHAEGSG